MKTNSIYSQCKNTLGTFTKAAFVLLAAILLLNSNAMAQKLGTSFSQYANEPGSEQWIPSALIPNNSQYYEGTSTLQRLVLVNIKPVSQGNNNHELVFKVLATKGGVNAYDFVTGFDQGLQDYVNITGSQITNSGFDPTNAADRLALVKGTKIPNPATANMIDDLFTSSFNDVADAPAPGDYGIKSSIVAGYDHASYPAFPALGGASKRGVQLYGNAAISDAVLVFNGYSAPDLDGDTYGLYKLTWISASDKVLILMAGHLATGDNGSPYSALWHGLNLGASNINGGPYHFKLENLDGISLGNQDNQIQSGAITVFQSNCSIPAAGPVCEGATTTHTATSTQASGAQYDWVITGDGMIKDGSNLVSSLTTNAAAGVYSSSVDVVAGGDGSYTLSVTITKSGFVTHQCSVTVVVNGNPAPPVVALHAAEICGTRSAPALELLCPIAGLYTVKQPNEAHKYLTYPGDFSTDFIENLVAGKTFSITVTVAGCTSDSVTCDNYEAILDDYEDDGCPVATRVSKPGTNTVIPSSIEKAKVNEMTAYPVPFSDKVTLEFTSEKNEHYVINLYDINGRLIKELKSGKAKAGEVTKVEVDGKGMIDSMYYARKVSKSGASTIKLLKKE